MKTPSKKKKKKKKKILIMIKIDSKVFIDNKK